jgi:antitoxin component of MazEF toxin-antitoxin module
MSSFTTTPKQWGNSLGITIPHEIVQKDHLSTATEVAVVIIKPQPQRLEKMFGTLKLKKPTQQVMNEIDEGYD